MPKYNSLTFQKLYDSLLEMASNPMSELYYNGLPHRGAAHRCAFWDGYAGVKKSANVIPGTLSAVSFAAGKAYFKINPEIAVADAVWTPGVTRQGEVGPRPRMG
jgi:hypothetical protein